MAEVDAKDARAMLDGMAAAFADAPLTPAIEACVDVCLDAFAGNFETKAAAHGPPWPPRKDKKPHPLLNLSGTMKAAAIEPGAPGHIERIEPRAAVLGIDAAVVEYAATQNYGDPARNIPQREYEDIPDTAADRCAVLVADEVARQL